MAKYNCGGISPAKKSIYSQSPCAVTCAGVFAGVCKQFKTYALIVGVSTGMRNMHYAKYLPRLITQAHITSTHVRLRRPHESSSKPPGRPSTGEVQAGGHGSGRSKRQGPSRVEKRPRSAESARISTPMITRRWICHIYLYLSLIHI